MVPSNSLSRKAETKQRLRLGDKLRDSDLVLGCHIALNDQEDRSCFESDQVKNLFLRWKGAEKSHQSRQIDSCEQINNKQEKGAEKAAGARIKAAKGTAEAGGRKYSICS